MRFERSLSGTVHGESYDPSRDRKELPPVVTPEKTPEQMEMLMDRVSKSSFMVEIDEKRMIEALKRFRPKEMKSGETLFKQGEDANIGYIVEEGKLRAFKRKRDNNDANDKGDEFRTYSPDEPCIDEGALLWIDKRPCTVIAETDAKLWEIERVIYHKVLARLAWEKRKLYMMFLDNVRLLEQVKKCELVLAMSSEKFAKGDAIIKEGDEPDGIYFVEEGEVELTTKTGEKKILRRADCFGELALLTTKLREETCKAKTNCEVAFLSVEDFERLMGRLQVFIKRRPGQFKKICKEFLGTENPDDDILR